MSHYIGVRMCEAEPEIKNGIPGYSIKFSNGHKGWYPKEVFESVYHQLEDPTGTIITESDVIGFIKHVSTNPIGGDTMLTHAITKNKYDVYTVSPGDGTHKDYNHEIGYNIVKSRIYRTLSFILKWGRSGLL